MKFVDWHRELKDWQQEIAGKDGEYEVPLLREKICCIDAGCLLVFTSDTPIQDISVAMSHQDCDFALIQNSSEVIEGVIGRRSIERTLSQSDPDEHITASFLTEADSFGIVSDNSSISEVLNKMTYDKCSCVVVVDHLARPRYLISPRSMLLALIELLPGEVIMVGGV